MCLLAHCIETEHHLHGLGLLRVINSEVFLGGEYRLEEVAASSSWVLLVAGVDGKLFSLAASGIWDLFPN